MKIEGAWRRGILAVTILAALACRAETITWTGAASTNWDLAGNWDLARIPASTDDVVIDGGARQPTLNLAGGAVTVGSLGIGSANVSTLTLSRADADLKKLIVSGSAAIGAHGVLTHVTNGTTAAGELHKVNLEVGGNLTLAGGGRLDADEKGYAVLNGPGAGGSHFGASHGGRGGYHSGIVKAAYGSIRAPVTLGSGGSGTGNPPGGGAVIVRVKGAFTHNGLITVNGGTSTYGGGGGSGGSILIETGNLSGNGTNRASGGTVTNYYGGGGGGGRIAVVVTNGTSAGAIVNQAFGANGCLNGVSNPNRGAAAGTIFVRVAGETNGTLVVDNSNALDRHLQAVYTELSADDWVFDAVVVTNGGILPVRSGMTLTPGALSGSTNAMLLLMGGTLDVRPTATLGILPLLGTGLDTTTIRGHLVLPPGSRLSHQANGTIETNRLSLIIQGNLVVEPGASLDVVGRGFAISSGPGAGTLNVAAAHGGTTGRGLGACYGSLTAPVRNGSGGTASGAYGGGAVELRVDGVVTNNGSILADGSYQTGHYPGSGGSIYIVAGALSGTGAVRAAGGSSGQNTEKAGGGRVSIVLTNASTFGNTIITAPGGNGPGTQPGAAGTVHLKTADQVHGTLIVDNGTNVTAAACRTMITTSVTDTVVGSVVIRGRARLDLAVDRTLTVHGDWSNGTPNAYFYASNGSTVVFAGTNTATVWGDNSFYNTTCSAPGKTLRFESGRTQTVLPFGALTWEGSVSLPLILRPTAEETGWRVALQPNGIQSIAHVDVRGSDASGGQTLVAPTGIDSGNNTNWNFSSGARVTWTGAANTNWSTPGNWDGNTVPVSLDSITIPVVGSGNYPELSANVVAATVDLQSGASLDLKGYDMTVNGDFTNNGTLKAGAGTLRIRRDARLSGGSVEAGSSTLVLDGEEAQLLQAAGLALHDLTLAAPEVSVSGAWSGRRLTVERDAAAVAFAHGFAVRDLYCERPGVALTFATGAVVAVDNLLLVSTGASPVVLRSAQSGTPWRLAVERWQGVRNVDAKDSDASAGLTIRAIGSANSGGNSNWDFGTWSAWSGSVDSNFFNPTNWIPEGVPGPGAGVLIDGGAVVPVLAVATSLNHLTIGLSRPAQMVVNKPLALAGDLLVGPYGTLRHGDNATSVQYRLELEIGGDLVIASNGAIQVTGLGYDKGWGPGTVSGDHANGGSHGGQGGQSYWLSGLIATSTYGSTLWPTNLGSGGGARNAGTSGGGAFAAEVTGSAFIDGAILARGDNQVADHGGAGSGGSIALRAAACTGMGLLDARGGNALLLNGAGGGGGRIAVRTLAGGAGDLTMRAGGGAGTFGSGAAGTVFLQAGSLSDGEVRIDNGGVNSGLSRTPLPPVLDGDAQELRRIPVLFTNAARGWVCREAWVGDLTVKAGCSVAVFPYFLHLNRFEHDLDDPALSGEGSTNRVDRYEQLLWLQNGTVILLR